MNEPIGQAASCCQGKKRGPKKCIAILLVILIVLQGYTDYLLFSNFRTQQVPVVATASGSSTTQDTSVLAEQVADLVIQKYLSGEYDKVGGKDNYDLIAEYGRLQLAQQTDQLKGAVLAMQQMKNNPKTGSGSSASAGQQATPISAADIDALKKIGYIDGPASARILVLEYSDLECPFCIRQTHNGVMDQLKAKYGDSLAHIYRTYRGVPHKGAETKAVAVLCAGKLGGKDAYYGLIKSIFAGSDEESPVDLSKIPDLATQAGVSQDDFNTCWTDGRTQNSDGTYAYSKDAPMVKEYDAETQEGVKFGVNGTPGNVIIDTKTDKYILVSGAQPISQFISAIDSLLKPDTSTSGTT